MKLAANAAAYQTGQTGYAVSHAPAAGTYTAQRAPSTYDGSYPTATSHAAASYPAPSTTYDYGYTARPPTQPTAAAAAAAAAAVYDTKTYYGQPAAAAAAAAAATVATPYTAAETHYQNAALRPSTVAAAAPKTSYAAGYSVTSASPAPYNTTSYTAQSTSAANKGHVLLRVVCRVLLRVVVKLHEKLGKPIPSQDPVVVGGKTSAGTTSTSSGVAGGASTTTTTEVATSKSTSSSSSAANKKEMMADAKEDLLELKEKEVEPVGMEYIEEMKAAEGDGQGKVISFKCTLCDCRFNDPNAKEMHMKGRRHRLQYKKKVNPELQVREEVWRRREEELLLEQEERFLYDRSRRIDEPYDYMDWCQRFPPHRGPPPLPRPHHLGMGPPPPHPMMGPRHPFMHQGPPAMMRRPDSSDDRHVMARHADIYPSEEELAATQKIVSTTEKALKLVSDYLANLDAPKDSKKDVMKDVKIKKEPVAEKQELVKDKKERPKAPHGTTHFDTNDKKEEGSSRILKGVMRVGILAKGLLLRGDKTVELVVLCGEKPTRTLLDRVADALPQHLASLSGSTDEEQQYDVQRVVEEAAVQVTLGQHTVKVTLTAPVMREQLLQASSSESQVAAVKDAPDVLDKQKCLDALASLRHAKWFQARANGLQSCVLVIRIMRDLCQRSPTWGVMNNWVSHEQLGQS
ncbi:hypothetical protein HAZT_HAZT010687 [Hyalella azteca]|uniref:DZF domain-containing protein n=1 Tax=Hyalella azteca TaxID=294128 RepID=A0A6A0GTG7_HYAAZ|nr:hypothetical protein HAZT_HAZT010687 [Hyalella azteca]